MKSFHVSTVVFNVIMKMRIMRKECGKTSENQESDDDTTDLERVTNQDARKFIAGLRLYFMQEGNEDIPISALETYADFVQLQSVNSSCH
jgi:hypothetical protein